MYKFSRTVLWGCFTLSYLISPTVTFADQSYDLLPVEIGRLTPQFETLKPVTEPYEIMALSSFNNHFSDKKLGVSFSYNASNKLTVKRVTQANGLPTIARSFTYKNKEAAYLSVVNLHSYNLTVGLLSILNGVKKSTGEKSVVTTFSVVQDAKIKGTGIELTVQNNAGVATGGALIWANDIVNEKGQSIGKVLLTTNWGKFLNANEKVKMTYNGKSAPTQSYFKTREEALQFAMGAFETIQLDQKVLNRQLR